MNTTVRAFKTKGRIILLIAISVLSINTNAYAQGLETIGGGIIDFLLTNPKTADRFNPSQTAALDVIGGLLKLSAQRKHELNFANVGKTEVVINTNDNRQATLYADSDGNFYLLFNNIVYPLSTSLVNQARGEPVAPPVIKNSTLPAYNLSILESEFQFRKTRTDTIEYFLKNKEETIDEITKEYDVAVGNCIITPVHYKNNSLTYFPPRPFDYDWFSKRKLIKQEDGKYKGYFKILPQYAGGLMYFTMFIKLNRYEHQIMTTFTCNWAYDFAGDGLGIDDFQGIKRSFYDNENILFVMGTTTENPGTYDFKIYEASTGKEVKSKTGSVDGGGKVNSVLLKKGELPHGVYLYTFKLMSPGEETLTKTEKFEIIASGEETETQTVQNEESLVVPCYIIGCSTKSDEASAKSEVEQLQQKGFRAGYMWAPDYEPNGKAAYRVYVGPFKTEKSANESLTLVRQHMPSAYVKLIQ